MRLVLILLVIFFGWMQYELWVGKGSKTELRELRHAVEVQAEENNQLQERNDALQAEVSDLKSGIAAIEELARSEMGMIKKDETFYQIIEPAKSNINIRPNTSSNKKAAKE
jgi:cell division protein FtsB